jgi:hypothetical protein
MGGFDTIQEGPLSGYAPETSIGLDVNASDVYVSGKNLTWVLVGGSSITAQGGTTGQRPVTPVTYQTYFDTTLGIPVWYTGTQWVNAAGVPS